MINTLIKNIIRFTALVLLQVLILNNINLGGFINPYLYILVILSLPIETSRWLTLLIGLGTGLAIDIFTRTPGMHMSAGVFLAFVRPYMLQYMAPRDGYEIGDAANLNDMGPARYITYAGLLTLMHHTYLFFVEAFTVQSFFRTLGKSIFSAALTLLLILIVQVFVVRKKSGRL